MRVQVILRAVALLVCLLRPGAWALASVAEPDPCGAAIARAERAARLPAGLLAAVAHTEAGRRDPDSGRAVAWPWTVNNGGDGRYFPSKAAAIAHVEALRAQGRRNIDVGCMQINLMHHPEAFASLEQAFEPSENVGYGADFLARLREETGSWDAAVARYHTADSVRGQAYRDKVIERLDEAPLRLQRRPPAPALFPRPPSRGSLAARGYLALTTVPSRVAVLRPGSQRSVRGVIRPDGTIEGSRLRIGPQRRGVPTVAAPPAAAGLAAPRTGAVPFAGERPPLPRQTAFWRG